MSRACPQELAAGYEALRAQATGGLAPELPRGMAVMVTQGLPAWIRAWAVPASVPASPIPAAPTSANGRGAEVVRLLTEMVLSGGRRLAVS